MCFLNFIENPEGAGFFGHSKSVVCNLQVPKLISNLLAWPNTHQMFSQPFVLFVFSMISPCTRLNQKNHFFIRLVHLNQVGLVVHIIHLIEASTENCWISSTPGSLAFPHTAAAPPRWRWCPRLWTWQLTFNLFHRWKVGFGNLEVFNLGGIGQLFRPPNLVFILAPLLPSFYSSIWNF